MGAQKGRALLIKLQTGAGYTAIGGTREKTITINNELVDITNSDSNSKRKTLPGAGVNSLSIKLEGVYVDDEYIGTLRDAAMNDLDLNMQVVIPGDVSGGTYTGPFQIATFEESGSYNGSINYSLTLESSDEITFE